MQRWRFLVLCDPQVKETVGASGRRSGPLYKRAHGTSDYVSDCLISGFPQLTVDDGIAEPISEVGRISLSTEEIRRIVPVV